MYLHAGNDKIIRTKSIIGIFDMDNATQSADTRAFLRRAQGDGRLENTQRDIPKSFVLYEKDGKADVCISQLSTLSLVSRVKKSKL